MEYKCQIGNDVFNKMFEEILDKLSVIYSLDTKSFLEVWDTMPNDVFIEVCRLSRCAESKLYEGTELEDLVEYADEIWYWVSTETRKRGGRVKRKFDYDEETPRLQAFTLRNPVDLKSFETFLDLMIELMNLSLGHFIEVLPKCPLAYWDKIDDLRETSYKFKRDSVEYLRCLEKCKVLSFTYSEYAESLSKIKEDEY